MIRISQLSKSYRSFGSPPVTALSNVSIDIPDNSSVGLVGESGSGKTTLLRCLMRLEQPDSGSIFFNGADIVQSRGSALRKFRSEVQMVFQDPMASINPRLSIQAIIEEGMKIHIKGRDARQRKLRVGELLEMVGLNPDHMQRRPASFSGGQRQRIAIARALAVEPRLLVCDEPVSALDVSVQAQILNLLLDMREALGLSLLFVAHDLGVVRYVCPDIYVLRHGELVERAPRDELFTDPKHDYTKELIAALPKHDKLRPASSYKIPPQQILEV